MTGVSKVLTRQRGRNRSHAFLADSRIGFCSNQCVTGIREPDMLTKMTERDWSIVLEVFDGAQSKRGEPGHDDRKFLEAIHYFTVHSITWRAARRIWQLEQRLETVLAAEPLRGIRGILPDAGGM